MLRKTLPLWLALLVACPLGAQARPRKKAAPAPAPAVVKDESGLIAEGAIVLDAFTGEVLFEKEGAAVFYPASATKILTALLVIEAGGLDEEVEIMLEDTQVEPTAIYFKPGQRYTRRELLYALMLKSCNDVACALARDNAGSVAAFAEKMTERAAALGAQGSRFMNPHGLHHAHHYTTPHDLALIARAAMEQPEFRAVVGTQHHVWPGAEGAVPLRNSNRMLRTFPGCTGLKTGYTRAARHVLVCAALRDGREVISVVMASDKLGKWSDSALLLERGLAEVAPAKKEHGPEIIQPVPPATALHSGQTQK